MCFTIPLKVLKVSKDNLLLEGGKEITLEKDLKVKKGDFVRVSANIAVDHLTKEEGENILNLIKSIYKDNE